MLLDRWNWDQIVQIFYFIKVQLFLLFSGRIIGITLWLQRFLGFMGVKRFQGTIYSELFLLLLIPLWWHLSRKKRNPTYRIEIVIRQEHGVHASTTLAAIGYFFSSSFNINSGMIRILRIRTKENAFHTSLWCLDKPGSPKLHNLKDTPLIAEFSNKFKYGRNILTERI